VKYELLRTEGTFTVEIQTDHKASVCRLLRKRKLPSAEVKLADGIMYSCVCTVATELPRVFQWAQLIDDTVTPQDIIDISPFRLSAVEELRFYAELNEMGVSHLE